MRAQFDVEVRLKETRFALSGEPGAEVDEAERLNIMIGDILILQAADESGVTVSDERVQSEINSILLRVDFSPEEMDLLLAEHLLAWGDFESSVRDSLIIAAYFDEVVLAEAPANEQQSRVQSWLVERYADSDITFDEDFLNQINAPDILSPEEL